jgi:AcrR family transcriptional regulator
MPQPTRKSQARGVARRKQIIEAALACFSEQGFGETTMEQIRTRAGASTGSIYHQFRGKEELGVEVYLEGLEMYQAGFVEELERRRDAEAGVRAIIAYHMGWVRRHPDWARYLFQMRQAAFLVASEQRIGRLNVAFVGRVGDWLRPHVRAGRIRRVPRELYASLLLGPCQEFSRAWLAGRADVDWEIATRELADAAWRTLGA